MPPSTPAARSTRGYVVELLREAILDGRLQPGDQLRQDRLAADFAVSAAPVREALRQLESDGLVVHHANRGAFVSSITESEIVGVLLPLRLHLERYAYDQASIQVHDDLVGRLEDLVDLMRAAASGGDLRGVTEADVAFHRAIVDAADSTQTLQLWDSIQWRLRMQFQRLGDPASRLPDIADEHAALLTVLRSNDATAVHRALEEHIVHAAEQLIHSQTTSSRSV